MAIELEGRQADGSLKPRYTCAGTNIWPRLFWAGAPATTKEIVLLVRTLEHGKLTTNWIAAGIPPTYTEVREGKLPRGAFMGRNSFGQVGYSVCPKQKKGTLIVFAVYALPEVVSLKPGFDQTQVLPALDSPNSVWGAANTHVR